MIKIAENLSLPTDVVTQTAAIIAKRRAGKSYTARRFAEELFRAEQQLVIVDPKGDWWGIRSSADGKAPGLPVTILGGEHGDVPLESNAGELVAKLVVEERVSVLIDVSFFRKHEVATFMAIFLENFYRLKAKEQFRTPVMLIIDEADAIAPQKPQKGEERMLGAAEDIVRRGGQRGIGCLLVTQRSAVLNKNVLTQSQIIVALRTIAPQDIAALDAWIDVHGTDDERKTLLESIASLPTGDSWFWSPGWPHEKGIFKRVHVLPITTFDSGATPKPGERRIQPKNLADIDLEALKRQMAATIEKARADDPRELRRRIAELERQLKQRPAAAAEPVEVKVPVIPPELMGKLDQMTASLLSLAGNIPGKFLHELRELKTAVLQFARRPPAPSRSPIHREALKTARNSNGNGKAPERDLTGVQARILRAVRSLEDRDLPINRVSVARWIGIHPNGGRFNEALRHLKEAGLLDEHLNSTGQGATMAPLAGDGPEGVLELLDQGKRRLFEEILQHNGLSREELAEKLGLHPNGGRFNANLRWLKDMAVIADRGPLKATEGVYR
jgi:hypothetical protein